MKNNALRNLIVSGFNDRPALIAAAGASEVAGWLRNTQDSAAASDEIVRDDTALDLCAAAFGVSSYSPDKPFVFADGIAYIPVYGTLINRFSYYSSWYGVTGYQYIRSMFDAALADHDVRGIVFDVNSHGGQVYGCFELADYIREKRADKPSIAVVDAVACSAAYALSSAAGKLVVSPSGDVGSIGVICVHFDYSEMYKNIGIKVTPVMAGDHKFDGNPYEPLPDEVRKDLQAGVNKTYSQFVTLVSKNRDMEEQAIRSTEARVYDADEALELGLVDAVATAIDAVSAFHTELSGSNLNNRSYIMADNTNAGAAADIEQASKDATAASKTRIAGIINHDNAKGREALAQHLALNTDMSVEDAAATLAASAKVEPKSNAAADFAAAMGSENPNVGAGGSGDGEGAAAEDTADKRAARIVANYQSATGYKPAVGA